MNQRTDSETRSNNRRTLRIRPPLMIGSPAVMGRERRQGIIRSPSNQEANEPRSSEAASSSPLPPSPFESIEGVNKRGPRIKHTEGTANTIAPSDDRLDIGGRYRTEISHWTSGFGRTDSKFIKRIKDFVSNMTELLELDPPEVEEMASLCEMGFAFRQRTGRAHQKLRAANMDRIR